jgi:hypothetical protein
MYEPGSSFSWKLRRAFNTSTVPDGMGAAMAYPENETQTENQTVHA